jgi:hypothetical protein
MIAFAYFLDDVTVLDDGLDVGGRLVLFGLITNVDIKSGNHVRVSYTYHGAEFRTSLRTSWLDKIILSALAAELRAAAGLPAEVETNTTATQPSTR